MSEAEKKMSVSPSTPSSSSSEIYNQYDPKLVIRMKTEICYTCKEKGHWQRDCPSKLNSLNTNSNNNNFHSKQNYLPPVNIWCRCGHGFCEVKTVLSHKNLGKKYYACPIKRGKQCAGFVKWCECDGGKINECDLQPPPYKYPECECGAGVCEKVQGTERSGLVKYYFACPVGERHGSCGYRVWEDELLKKETVVTIEQSGQRTLNDFSEDVQHDKTDNELGEGDYLLVEHFKKMMRAEEISESDSENPKSMAASEFVEKEDIVQSAAPSKGVGTPEFDELVNGLQDQDLCYVSIKEDAMFLSRQSTTSMICCQENVFERHIFAGAVAAASFDGIFPSFNPIIVPKQASISDGPCVDGNQLAISNLSQHVQLSTGCHTEVTPEKSRGNVRKLMSKSKRQRQIVLFAQQQLLIDLESLNPNEHESMKEAAEATFDALDNLGVDYKQFYVHVCDYIDLSSSIAEIDKFMENSFTLDEYKKRVNEAKARFAQVQDDSFNTKTLLGESNKLRQSLIEEISYLEAMLHEKQTQLKSCELENLKIETHVGDLRKFLVEADANLKVTTEEAKVARKLNEERQAKQIAAKTALENAKLLLGN
ncbi:hypothetical protein Lal_00043256 [Lupinus albus]|uniref:Putative transcription factor interactor and regulator CCHC(Zn) family n=1 Tax=Lupinus albus TaxID=3870 RepID=A0A6A4NDH4_LUPAL|nr:putative transcription factor interactor and regulator CCHC(Zn) family [Lupinus albus]KAF1883593.1 hypothetical protein Lal_00043256 [Lupinus albus]